MILVMSALTSRWWEMYLTSSPRLMARDSSYDAERSSS
jgi:hypothetical protein